MALQEKNRKRKEDKSLLKSFSYGFCGIFYVIRKESHIKIALLIVLFGIASGIYLKISSIEWVVCILHSSLVITLEMINTAIEKAVDISMPNIHPIAKIAKDVAAGAVVFSCISALISGIIIFLPKIIELS